MLFIKDKHVKEKKIDNFCFNVYKFTKKKKLDNILIITNFCELGVETLACNYSIPQLLSIFNGYYIILVGWTGREYFYRHLADEFWELKEEDYWLKDSCNAFWTKSKNIEILESKLKKIGILFKSQYLGNFLITYVCKRCFYSSYACFDVCSKCGNNKVSPPLLGAIQNKKFSRSIPKPKENYVNEVKKIVPKRAVAVFARNRKTYGRNLPKDFYYNLNKILVSNNFTPVYLGENVSSLNMENCIDFSNTDMVKNLEFTLAVLSCAEFSVQLWTASTRLSSIVKTPFILVESADQLALRGQEGRRIAASSDFNKKKIIISNYLSFLNDTEKGLLAIEKSIQEIKKDNWDYILDFIEDKNMVKLALEKKGLLNW
jgi:hypothetical protein